MRTERWAGLTTHVVGGTDREGGGDGPVVALLHGFGAPGEDLVGLWRVIPVAHEVRFVFPEAPLELPELGPYGARAWWRLDLAQLEQAQRTGTPRDRSDELPEGMPEARERLEAWLDCVQTELGVQEERVVLGGFSQGGMLSCDLALRTSRPLAGLILLSSTLLCEADWVAAMPARADLPVLQSHGRQDPLLPFALAERLRDHFRAAGCDVTWIEFNGGHEVPMSVVEAIGAFVEAHT